MILLTKEKVIGLLAEAATNHILVLDDHYLLLCIGQSARIGNNIQDILQELIREKIVVSQFTDDEYEIQRALGLCNFRLYYHTKWSQNE